MSDTAKKRINTLGNNGKPENEQQQLLDSIWNNDSSEVGLNGFEAKGINIYRRHLFANALRSLSLSFPTVFELLDSDVSYDLTQQFLRFSPPENGDWAKWGIHFSAFIKSTRVGQDYPYLADCAILDWYVHGALHGKDQVLEKTSLQLLADEDPEHIFINFNENVQLLSTEYPVVEIFNAHHHQCGTQRDIAFNSAKHSLLSKSVAHDVMIYRPEFHPHIRRLTSGEGLFMQALMGNKSLADALDLVCEDADFLFEKWLVNAIKHNLIHYFKRIYHE